MSNINNLSCKNNKYRTDNKTSNIYHISRDVDFGYKDIKNSDKKYKGCDCNLLNKDEKKIIKNKDYNIKPESIKCAEAKYKFRYLYNNKNTSKNRDVRKRQGHYKRILLNYCNSNPYSCSNTDKYNMPKKIDEICGPKYLNVCNKNVNISDIPKDALKYFSELAKSISDININSKSFKNFFTIKLEKKTKKNFSPQQKIKKIENALINIKNIYNISTSNKFDFTNYMLCKEYKDFDKALAFIKQYTYANTITPEMDKIYSCIYNTDLLNKYIELELELLKLQEKKN